MKTLCTCATGNQSDCGAFCTNRIGGFQCSCRGKGYELLGSTKCIGMSWVGIHHVCALREPAWHGETVQEITKQHMDNPQAPRIRLVFKDFYYLCVENIESRLKFVNSPFNKIAWVNSAITLSKLSYLKLRVSVFVFDLPWFMLPDKDECRNNNGGCGAHRCINSPGSYSCLCTRGFREDNGRCIGIV